MADRSTLLRSLAAPGAVQAADQTSHCPSCGYAMTGLNPEARCPECGIERSAAGALSPEYLRRLATGATVAAIGALAFAAWMGATGVGLLTDSPWLRVLLHPIGPGALVVLASAGLWHFSLPEPTGDRVAKKASRWRLVPCFSVAAAGFQLASTAMVAHGVHGADCWWPTGAAVLCACIAGFGALGETSGVLTRMGDWKLAAAFDDLWFTILLTALVGAVIAIGPFFALLAWGAAMLKFASRAHRGVGTG